ncbi:hypothetical protein EDEG_00269 [Edhazardia aedis USNM 41457]|uniref:Uncharacterized protein n=1 Tax=Edhazardia aedis (strain USNM 41457) TaxID=1003232 RepID=J9DJ13_EDHAE|nr:hypothetical protein EDEG_00269 [Edhazardia aedis USNM 41457]|eukprot:EJW02575.1 hypothetical protein EDEG_00269 [Edhazardia aedis USNM 41457]
MNKILISFLWRFVIQTASKNRKKYINRYIKIYYHQKHFQILFFLESGIVFSSVNCFLILIGLMKSLYLKKLRKMMFLTFFLFYWCNLSLFTFDHFLIKFGLLL